MKKNSPETPDLFENTAQEVAKEVEKTEEKPQEDSSQITPFYELVKEEETPEKEKEATTKETSSSGLPSLLEDGAPYEENGELTLARFAAKAYLEYALSVVKGRALPDVFDGLKPVQRRILYAMQRMKLTPPAKAVKCARVVGDVLGKYHPHGDQAAYEAMVRMAQSFTLRYPLVDGEGNFGSRDGDGPAAMRYTEARLTKISELLLSEIDTEDVDFVPNYDGSFEEPALLPARMPFVLLNGASGIAVGLATEIPSHNLTEVGNAVLLLLERPEATLEEVLEVLPAPDFPGGGQIISTPEEIRDIYRTGRGSLKLRARWHFEELQRNQWQLVIDELPPAASAELVLSQIEDITNPKPKAGKKALSADQLQAKTQMLSVLESVRNECDKDTPMRIVFEPKTSKVDRDAFVNLLLSSTSLESNAPMNLVVVGTDGHPAQKGLLAILSEWVAARILTVKRRSEARLAKVRSRLHILEGRKIAVDNIDRVIEIVRFDPDPKARLIAEFNLTDVQAEDILELRLRQLANLEFEKLLLEVKKLEEEARALERLIASEKLLRREVAKETREAVKTYGDARRTLVQAAKKATFEVKPVNEPVTVVLSKKGFVRSRGGHGHDATLMSYKIGDAFGVAFECNTEDTLVAFGDNGRVYSVAVSSLPPARGDGMPISSFFDLEPGTAIIGYAAGPRETKIVLASNAGMGLSCTIGDLTARVRAGKAFMKLDNGAKLLRAAIVGKDDDRLACLSSEGRLLVFELTELRTLSEGGKGVTLMELNVGEKLLDALPLGKTGCVVEGVGRTTTREKTLTHGDFERHFARRARKGKALEIRFNATALKRIVTDATGAAKLSDAEETPEPQLL